MFLIGRVRPAFRTSFASLLVVASAALVLTTAGCAATRGYDDVLRNRTSCDSCRGSDWTLYREMSSGTLKRCDPACACAEKPALGCATTDAYPKDAKPGEAWCRVVIPARYENVREPIETSCAEVRRVWVAPVTEIRLHRVCVSPASDEVIRTPGATRTDVMCCEGSPARTQTRTVTVQGPCGCETRCETVTIPAKNCTTKREVCIQAPGRHAVTMPASYVEDPCVVEIVPGHWIEEPTPAVVEMRERIVCLSPERVEWRRNPNCAVPVSPPYSSCVPATKR